MTTGKKTTSRAHRTLYSEHPSIEYAQRVVADMPEKTGRSLEAWVTLLKKDGPRDDRDQRTWLKSEHGLGANYAAWVTERAAGRGAEDTDPAAYLALAPQYVEDMYNKKPALRPIYDALIETGRGLGADVRICPCKTIVPLYRAHVFAQIKPSTKSRLDFGLALKAAVVASKMKPGARLIETGGMAKSDRITHRFALGSVDDIDDEVIEWMTIAYEHDAN